MLSPSILGCIVFLVGTSFTRAEPEPSEERLFIGPEADEEIRKFMTMRWYRQSWQIEHKEIEGASGASPAWHVNGTRFWIRIDGPEHLKKGLDLKSLDPGKVYEFTGVPVDQNYGVITFYALSRLEPVREPQAEGVAEQGGDGRPAMQSRQPTE